MHAQEIDLQNATILVTGGAGFIGSHLVEELLAHGAGRVISLDNYFTGSSGNHIEGAEYREGDTREIADSVPETPSIVYHLGEYPRVEQSFDDVETVWNYNAAGTFQVLEFCRARGSKVVYAGSSTKFTSDELGINLSPYAWTKAANTALVQNYGHWFGVPYAITYFYNVYGPRERAGTYGTVIEIFRQKYLAGEPLPVRRPGTQRRNFTHVKDIVDGLVRVGLQAEGDNYGIGDPHDYSILEIAELFGADIKLLPERKGNRLSASINTNKTEALGWKPRYSIEEYIRGIVEA